MKTVLSIAGSDCSGGAGIQADLKTMLANGVYGMSAITTLTAQNTTGVFAVEEVSSEFLKQQLDAVFSDIFPDAVKIGMLPSAELVEAVVESLKNYGAKNIVTDPVMVSTSGCSLINKKAVNAIVTGLFPVSRLVTPNIPEAEVLTEIAIENKKDMERAALMMYEKYGCAVLLKGGHSINDANDVLASGSGVRWFCGKRVDNSNTHGTGCTLSSAIASCLAKGFSLEDSIFTAKKYVSGALEAMLDLGKGSGPIDHGFCFAGGST
ncbi:MAG: bifunctional hydroxymethylpyrimidine kinase/phosphomethylpyrimidine kinase [Sphaerochaetaceae bacterium]|nr:bifunctional hydroxymethylpyrimidine kinase/phosphomethylpyrimidine kinase [Sphaerochaetaceae bacterium]